MSYIEPNTSIRFLTDVPLDPDYENTLYFPTRAAQTEYFLSKGATIFEKNSYQRAGKGVLKVGAILDELGGSAIQSLFRSSYMMFKNTNFENKWFYAFVDKVEYINNNTVSVRYHLDVIQTWLLDFINSFNDCLIEREHTVTDVAGENLVPESLETGDYLLDEYERIPLTPCVVIAITSRPSGNVTNPWEAVPGKVYHGRPQEGLIATGDYYSGVEYLAARLDDQEAITLLTSYLENVTIAGGIDSVVGMSMMPFEFLSQSGASVNPLTRQYDIPTTLGNYSPRNKKLLTWPYSGLYVSDMHGGNGVYEYEYFTKDNSNKVRFQVWGNMSDNPGVILYPIGYKNNVLAPNYDESLSCTGFPPCAFNYDAYKAWLAQNAGTLAISSMSAAATFLAPGVSAVARNLTDVPAQPFGLTNVTPQEAMINAYQPMSRPAQGAAAATLALLGQLVDHARKPAKSVGNSNGSLMYQAGLLTFLVGHKYIRQEFASIIDKYFDMYGYATHRVGTPNLSARPCYSYVKTVGCSIGANIPGDDCTLIQQIFDRGIRFWKSTARFGSFDPSINNNQV